MNTIRFTSKALLLTLVAGLGFQASANPTFAAVRAAASTVAQKAAEFAKPAVTFVASKLPKATFTSGTVAGTVAGGVTGSVATQALTKTTEVATEVAVQEAPKAVSTFGLSSLGKYGLAAAVAGTAVVGYGLYRLVKNMVENSKIKANLALATKLQEEADAAATARAIEAARQAELERAANCPTCPTSVAKSAPVVVPQGAQGPRGSLANDITLNGKQISYFREVAPGQYRAIERGSVKVKKGMGFILPCELPKSAEIVA